MNEPKALSPFEAAIRETERMEEIRRIFLDAIIPKLCLPAFGLFAVFDVIFFPNQWKGCIAIRALIIPLGLAGIFLFRRVRTSRQADWMALFFTSGVALILFPLFWYVGDSYHAYYAGLILVTMGSTVFIPFSEKFWLLSLVGIFLPYYVYKLGFKNPGWILILFESCHIIIAVLISYFIRKFQENLRISELLSRLRLESEVVRRDKVIREKTTEAVGLELAVRENQIFSEVAKRVSHDIRSPVSALNLVVSAIEEVSTAKKALLLEATSRVNSMADELLRVAKSQHIISSVQGTELRQIGEVIGQIVSEKKILFGQKQIEIRSEWFIEGDDRRVSVDLIMLKRILSNIINNSMEAIERVGHIKIRGEAVRSEFAIAVSDTGIGIPKEVLAKVGNEGFSHGKRNGYGLGLYTAKLEVERWGGRLHVDSESGKGTTVSLKFPII